jgi:hypothetical protein
MGVGHGEMGHMKEAGGTTEKRGYGLKLSQRSRRRGESNGVGPK